MKNLTSNRHLYTRALTAGSVLDRVLYSVTAWLPNSKLKRTWLSTSLPINLSMKTSTTVSLPFSRRQRTTVRLTATLSGGSVRPRSSSRSWKMSSSRTPGGPTNSSKKSRSASASESARSTSGTGTSVRRRALMWTPTAASETAPCIFNCSPSLTLNCISELFYIFSK